MTRSGIDRWSKIPGEARAKLGRAEALLDGVGELGGLRHLDQCGAIWTRSWLLGGYDR